MQNGYEHLTHIFEPVFDGQSRVLILGTFPSVKSRENQFYYGHPQNRFWRVLAGVCAGCGAGICADCGAGSDPSSGEISGLRERGERISGVEECREPVPGTIAEKRAFLLHNHIAIWDVIAACDIVGSSDSSIRNVTPNDLHVILDRAPIRQIFANGAKAYDLYQKYSREATGREIVRLPSTSPANAAFSLDRLVQCWGAVKSYL